VSPPGMIEVPTGTAARAVFTTRREADVRRPAGRRELCASLGIDPARVVLNRQVHGARVRAVDAPDAAAPPDGDGLVTGAGGLALAVVGADCLPVLMWRDDVARVAACHAGWRGLVAGVVEATAAALGEPARVRAAIGPGIGPCCYQVSSDVRATFVARFGAGVVVEDRVDLPAAARAALAAAGVPAGRVRAVGACTRCHPDRFFSFRRDGRAAGRQAGIVWATGEAA
jgi:polyphenol oxidase